MSFGDGFGETLAFENLQKPYILKIDRDFFCWTFLIAISKPMKYHPNIIPELHLCEIAEVNGNSLWYTLVGKSNHLKTPPWHQM